MFEDLNLEVVVCLNVFVKCDNDELFIIEDVEWILIIEGKGEEIMSFKGLEYCCSLVLFDFENNKIIDLLLIVGLEWI